MGKKIALLVAIVVFLMLAGTAVSYFTFPPQKTHTQLANSPQIKTTTTTDLSGKWESAESKLGTKMFAQIKDNRIHIEMYVNEGYSGLWYGTFDLLQPGKTSITSTAIDDADHFVLSSAESKEFIYQGDSLIFEYTVLGNRTAVEMKRV